jgi:hypothetical protein
MLAGSARSRDKGDIFALAYRRAQRALRAGFYLETIIICDSLLTDRLRLILTSNFETDIKRTTTGSITNYLIGQRVISFDESLWADILAWSRKRNHMAHAMGAISGDSLTPWKTRLAEAREVAESGFALVNRVSKEAKQHRL